MPFILQPDHLEAWATPVVVVATYHGYPVVLKCFSTAGYFEAVGVPFPDGTCRYAFSLPDGTVASFLAVDYYSYSHGVVGVTIYDPNTFPVDARAAVAPPALTVEQTADLSKTKLANGAYDRTQIVATVNGTVHPPSSECFVRFRLLKHSVKDGAQGHPTPAVADLFKPATKDTFPCELSPVRLEKEEYLTLSVQLIHNAAKTDPPAGPVLATDHQFVIGGEVSGGQMPGKPLEPDPYPKPPTALQKPKGKP
jgi:hypothetical protein